MSDGVSASVSGSDALARAIEEQVRDLRESTRLALVIEAAVIAGDAAARCPVQTGALQRSVRVVPSDDGAAVAFLAPYAVEVHERIDVVHPNGEAKFLEHATQSAAGDMAENVASRIKIG